ncbi:MAG: class I SAM-dependent RNA methyltransferase [Alphaproteobacteria bacterium]|nr:class I SAM-dependent RNA methyltransferase [Alphaproteobacteria bacterium]
MARPSGRSRKRHWRGEVGAQDGTPAEPIRLQIDTLGRRGDGVARHGGRAVYVAQTLPGEELTVRLGEADGDGVRAEAIELIEASPQRVEPPCPHFGPCGGCSVQHVSDPLYAEWKLGIVRTALDRAGFAGTPMLPIARSAPGTRRRAAFRALRGERSVFLGFSERASHRIVDVTDCRVVVPSMMPLLTALRALLGDMLAVRQSAVAEVTATDGGIDMLLEVEAEATLPLRERAAAFASEQGLARLTVRWGDMQEDPIVAARPATVTFDGIPVPVPPGTFLQATRSGEDALRGFVLGALSSGSRPGRIVDLFAGCGSFALPLARLAPVLAVEGDEAALEALAMAARAAGLPVRTELRDLAKRPLRADELAASDVVVFDPPRLGAKAQAEQIADSPVRQVFGISCNPSTFARDAAVLGAAGFALESVLPVDQFLWSAHVELAGRFRR